MSDRFLTDDHGDGPTPAGVGGWGMSGVLQLKDDDGDILEVDPCDGRITQLNVYSGDHALSVNLSCPDQTRALHRYLSALVLPTVERRMLETSRYCGQEKRESVYVSSLGVAASCVGRAVVCGETMMSIEVARAKAACLLAAADEAEGVTPC